MSGDRITGQPHPMAVTEQALRSFPDLLLQRELAVRAAAQFWHSRGLNELADHNDADK